MARRYFPSRFVDVPDNALLSLRFATALPPGTYYLEMAEPAGDVGWWSAGKDVYPGGQAYSNGKESGGDRTLRIDLASDLQRFFTFRKPQPDYFAGPTGPEPSAQRSSSESGAGGFLQ